MDFVLSNSFLEFTIQYLEPEVLNENAMVLFYKITKIK